MFELIDEIEDPTGCTWTIQALDSEGSLQRTRVRLGWADYGVWSPDGGISPERVAEAVVAPMTEPKQKRRLCAAAATVVTTASWTTRPSILRGWMMRAWSGIRRA